MKYDDDKFTSMADAVLNGEEGTESIQRFMYRWAQWNFGDSSWSAEIWEMLSYPPDQREELMEEWE